MLTQQAQSHCRFLFPRFTGAGQSEVVVPEPAVERDDDQEVRGVHHTTGDGGGHGRDAPGPGGWIHRYGERVVRGPQHSSGLRHRI